MLSKLLLIWILIHTVITTIIVSIVLFFALLIKIFNRQFRCYYLPQIIIRIGSKLALIFHKIEIVGKANLQRDRPQIIFANHQSNLDILLFNCILDIPFCWLAKESLFRIPIFGWMLRELGFIPVIRDNTNRGTQSITEGIEKLKNNISVVIFPEGTWNGNENIILPFKAGLYYLAKESNATILPIKIIGTGRANPPDTLKLTLAKLKVIIHPPIEAKDHVTEDKNAFLTEMREILQNI